MQIFKHYVDDSNACLHRKKIEWKKLKENWKVNALKENVYTDSFINSTLQPKRQTSTECAWPQSFVVIS